MFRIWVVTTVCGYKEFCVFQIFFAFLVPLRKISQTVDFFLSSLFLFWFWISGDCTSLLDASSSLRSNTELEDELEAGRTSSLDACSASLLNESCDVDVEVEPLSGLVDNPGTTGGTKFSVFELDSFFAHHVHWCCWIDYEFSLIRSFWSGCRHYPCFNRSMKRSFIRILELVNMFRQIPRCFAVATFLVQGVLMWSFPEFWRTKTELMSEVHTFG